MSFPTYYIPWDLYDKSVYDVIQLTAGKLQVCRHPFMVEIVIPEEQRETFKELGIDHDEYCKRQLHVAEAAYARRDVGAYVFAHARSFRFHALLDAKLWAPELQWFLAAGEVWIDSEGPGPNTFAWRSEVFNNPLSVHCMSENEQSFYKSLPEVINIFRGAGTRLAAKEGISWSLDKGKAIWFAKRFNSQNAWVASGKILKEHAACAFLGRGESEIVINGRPSEIRVSKI